MRASEMRKGQTVKIDDKLYAIVDYQHVKLGKGGAVYQTKLKSLTDGSIQNIRLRAEEMVEEAYLDKRTYEYLYSSGNEHVLMDTTTYDQITLDDETFGDGPKYLKPRSSNSIPPWRPALAASLSWARNRSTGSPNSGTWASTLTTSSFTPVYIRFMRSRSR